MAKSIGNRIIFSEKDGETVISISAQVERWKETLLLCWTIAWTIIGAYMIVQLFGDYPRETKLFFFVYICFWVYFEYKMLYAFVWRKWGTELIKIDDESIMLKRDINRYGKVTTYYFESIKDFSIVEQNEKSFATNYSNSFWIVGGETLVFEYLGKKVGFGMQLKAKDANALFKLIKGKIRKQ